MDQSQPCWFRKFIPTGPSYLSFWGSLLLQEMWASKKLSLIEDLCRSSRSRQGTWCFKRFDIRRRIGYVLVKTRSVSFAGLGCSFDLEFHNILLYKVSVSPWHFKFVKDFLYHLECYDIYAFRQIINFWCGLLLYDDVCWINRQVAVWSVSFTENFQVCGELLVSSGILLHLCFQSDHFNVVHYYDEYFAD